MTAEEAYSILGVEAGTAPKAVQAAYRKAAMLCHPDKARGPEEAAALTKRFIKVRDAYEHLRNEGFPVPQTEEVLEDVLEDFPPMTPAGRSFAPKKPDELQDVGLAEKLGLGFGVDLEAFSLWGVIIPGCAVLLVLFVRYLLRILTS